MNVVKGLDRKSLSKEGGCLRAFGFLPLLKAVRHGMRNYREIRKQSLRAR